MSATTEPSSNSYAAFSSLLASASTNNLLNSRLILNQHLQPPIEHSEDMQDNIGSRKTRSTLGRKASLSNLLSLGSDSRHYTMEPAKSKSSVVLTLPPDPSAKISHEKKEKGGLIQRVSRAILKRSKSTSRLGRSASPQSSPAKVLKRGRGLENKPTPTPSRAPSCSSEEHYGAQDDAVEIRRPSGLGPEAGTGPAANLPTDLWALIFIFLDDPRDAAGEEQFVCLRAVNTTLRTAAERVMYTHLSSSSASRRRLIELQENPHLRQYVVSISFVTPLPITYSLLKSLTTLHTISLPKFTPSLFSSSSPSSPSQWPWASLRVITFLQQSIEPDDVAPLTRWLARLSKVTHLSFPNLLDPVLSAPFVNENDELSSLKVLHACPGLLNLLSSLCGRLQLEEVTLNITTTLYTGLRPGVLVKALAPFNPCTEEGTFKPEPRYLQTLRLRFDPGVDLRTIEKLLGAIGSSLGSIMPPKSSSAPPMPALPTLNSPISPSSPTATPSSPISPSGSNPPSPARKYSIKRKPPPSAWSPTKGAWYPQQLSHMPDPVPIGGIEVLEITAGKSIKQSLLKSLSTILPRYPFLRELDLLCSDIMELPGDIQAEKENNPPADDDIVEVDYTAKVVDLKRFCPKLSRVRLFDGISRQL